MSKILLSQLIHAIEHIEDEYRDAPDAFCPQWAMNGDSWEDRKAMLTMTKTLRFIADNEHTE
jgi:hypothetical protein